MESGSITLNTLIAKEIVNHIFREDLIMQKTIVEKKKRTRILVPEVPAVKETYYEEIPRTVWDCDYCERGSGDKMSTCIGCGKCGCAFCWDKVFERLYFEVGDPGLDCDCQPSNSIPESDDYRIGSFYICCECKENPPEKIQYLMGEIVSLNVLHKAEEILSNKIIDEIERLNKENK